MFLIAVVCVVVLVLSFFSSLMEASLYAISRAQIETMRRQGDPKGIILSRLREHIDEPIAALLILNTSVNAWGSMIAGALVLEHYGNAALGVFSALFTAALLFVTEIVPKSLGFRFADRTAPALALPIKLLVTLLWPLVRLCVLLTGAFGPKARIAVTEEDIISMALMSEASGSVRPQEARWIANALNLDKLAARDIMTPASVVRRVAADMPLEMTRTDADQWRFSRIPVYPAGDPDQIVGVVERRVVFQSLVDGAGELRMQDLMSAPVFVSESAPCHELLNLFIRYRKHLFCVRDRSARWVGIVALEDVLEALIGTEIVGEQDLFENMQEAARAAEEAQLLTEDLKRGGGVLEHAVVSPESELVGKKLRESGFPPQALVGTVVRDGSVIVPHGDLAFQAGDKVTLIGVRSDVETAKNRLHPGVPGKLKESNANDRTG